LGEPAVARGRPRQPRQPRYSGRAFVPGRLPPDCRCRTAQHAGESPRRIATAETARHLLPIVKPQRVKATLSRRWRVTPGRFDNRVSRDSWVANRPGILTEQLPRPPTVSAISTILEVTHLTCPDDRFLPCNTSMINDGVALTDCVQVGLLGQGAAVMVKYEYVDSQHIKPGDTNPVSKISHWLQVSPSGFYQWRGRP